MSLVKMISKLQHANEASGHVGMISISEHDQKRATCFDQVDSEAAFHMIRPDHSVERITSCKYKVSAWNPFDAQGDACATKHVGYGWY